MTELLIILFIIIFIIWPIVRRRAINAMRRATIRAVEKTRGSRVITLIHRQEMYGFLGIPFLRYIDIEDSERILEAIRLTPPDKPIDLVVHTPGGMVLAAEQIAHAIKRHKGKVTVIIPHFAMSGGTLLAVAADEILAGRNAVMGPLDPVIGFQQPATSIIRAAALKDRNKLDDRTLIALDDAYRAVGQIKQLVSGLLEERLGQAQAEHIAHLLTSGVWTHDYPLTVDRMGGLGIDIKTEIPPVIYKLLSLYPPARPRRVSVDFIPEPYGKKAPSGKKKSS